ncbi:MAG: lasso peptide biosynthesis B2 protein [Steroidobacteraceae bacterium]
MSATTYFLSNNCFVCRAQAYWIILDAKHDQYLCVAHDDLMTIGHRLYGWRDQCLDTEHRPSPGVEKEPLIDSLLASEIITRNPKDGKSFAESVHPVRERSIDTPERVASAKPSALCILRFLLACARVDWQLRTKVLSRTLARIERRRRHGVSSAVNGDAAHVSTVISAFKALRPFYPRPYLCLFESLALLEFLARYRLFPHVVFGVVADPFQAHCWLQEGPIVLNDNLERVGKFRPILCV